MILNTKIVQHGILAVLLVPTNPLLKTKNIHDVIQCTNWTRFIPISYSLCLQCGFNPNDTWHTWNNNSNKGPTKLLSSTAQTRKSSWVKPPLLSSWKIRIFFISYVYKTFWTWQYSLFQGLMLTLSARNWHLKILVTISFIFLSKTHLLIIY